MGLGGIFLTVLVSLAVAGGASWYLYSLIEEALSQHTEDLLEDGQAGIHEFVSVLAARAESAAYTAGVFILSSDEVRDDEWATFAGGIGRNIAGYELFDGLLYAPRTPDGRFEISLAWPTSASGDLEGVDLTEHDRIGTWLREAAATQGQVNAGPIRYPDGKEYNFEMFIIPPDADEPRGVVILRRPFGSQLQRIINLFNENPDVIGVKLTGIAPGTGERVTLTSNAYDRIAAVGIDMQRDFSVEYRGTRVDIELAAPYGLGVPRNDRLLQLIVSAGAFISILGAMLTLTALYRSRKALARQVTLVKKAKKAVDEFASLASHQLKTPLTALKWSSELLLDESTGPLNERQRDLMSEVSHSVKRMINLVNKLLSASRVESGTFTAAPEPTDVAELVHAYVSDNAPAAASRNLTVTEDFDDRLQKVALDPQLVGAIVQNLISNAIRYTKPGGSIRIRTWKDGAHMHIAVTDTGIGIPKDALGPLWDKGFRTKEAEAMDSGGTGLGLYMVKNVINETGGSITVESEVGKGSTFTVSYPLSGMTARAGTKRVEVPDAEEAVQ